MSHRMISFWHRTAETAGLLLALLLPLAFYLKSYDSTMIKATLFQAGVLALASAWLLKGMEQGRWELPAWAKPFLLPAGLLLGWTLLGFFASTYKLAALPGFLEDILCLTAFAVFLLEFGGYENAARFAGWTLTAAWISGLYGLCQGLGLDPFPWKGAFGERVFSTLANPDLLALFLALCLPLALARLLDPERDFLLKAADLCLLALLGLNMAWTASPQGLACLTLTGIFSALIFPAFVPSKASLKVSGLSLALGLGAFAAVMSFGSRDFEKRLIHETEFKRQIWKGTLTMISEKPLMGHGPGSFAVHFPRFKPSELIRLKGKHNSLFEHPDNALLEVASEQGLLGAGLWLWLFGSVLWGAFRARGLLIRQAALGESCYLAGFSAAMAGALASSQFSLGYYYFSVPGWLLWPLAGIAAGLSGLARQAGPVTVVPLPLAEQTRKKLYAPASLAFLGLAVFPFQWLSSDIHHNIAIRHAKDKNWDKALAQFELVKPGSSAYVMAQYFKGNVYLNSGRPREALSQYAKLESLAPDYVQLHYQKAQAYAETGEWKKAMESHARVRDLDPLFAANYARWAIVAKRAGDLAAAKKAAYGAIALEPGKPSHRLTLAEIHLKEKRAADARRLQREAARLRRGPVARKPGPLLY